MRAKIRFNGEFGIWEVIQNGRVIYQTIDESDAREYAACQ